MTMDIKVVENENQTYLKQKLLGEGAFGKAYLVKHKQSGQQLVIKQMNIEHMSTKQKQQTIKQAQILSNLRHPNIINFREVYITKNNKLKIVMQYAQCGDLAKAIAQQKAKKQLFQQDHILGWFTQICLAIKHVHDRKILHRDIKGQNIFIAKNNSLKLGDFGIARVLNVTNQKARTVVGTPYYLSPQIIENKPYSFKSDIWSIGAVLYELCCLQPPFTATSLQMLALKIVKGSYPAIQGNYSKQLKSLVSQILTLDPNKRPSIHQILQKPVIQNRIRNFLSQTKRIAQFSHTILHNQKVQIFTNKLVQIQKQKQNKDSKYSAEKNQKNLQYQRQKLKEEQARIEAAMVKKKQQDKKKQDKKRQQQIRRREEQIKRKQQQKARRIVYQQQKKAQMQRQYEDNIRKGQMQKMRRMQQEKQYQKQIQISNLMRQKQQYEQRKRKQTQIAKKANKKLEEDKKMQDFNDFARKQYYQNLQIRKRAEQRARRDQDGYYDNPQPIKQKDIQPQSNFHFAQQNRPKTKQQSRNNSNDNKKQNISDFYNQKPVKKDPEPTQQQLINAFCNPNYKKGSHNPNINKQHQRPVSQKRLSQPEIKPNSKNQSQIKKVQTPSKKNDDMPVPEVGKWGKKKSSEKRAQKEDSPKNKQSPRFNQKQQVVEQKHFDSMIRDSQNLFLQVHNPAQFDKYIGQLQQILQGVHKKIQLLPEIPLADQIVFRDDDSFQLSLTVQPGKLAQPQIQTEEVDLDYFSNYSKLQTLRIQLQEALGLDNFIKLYRYIQKQVSQKGLQGFNINEAIKEVNCDIDSKVIHKNITLLLTLVAMEDKMTYS